MEVKESRYIGVKIDPDAIYTTKEAMVILKIKSQTTIIEKVKNGELRRSKLGQKVYYTGQDILDYIQMGRV